MRHLLGRQQAPEILDRPHRLLVIGDAEHFVEVRGEAHLDAPVIGVGLEQRPGAEPLRLVLDRLGEDVDGLDLAAGADERHAAPGLADLEAPVRIGRGLLALGRRLGKAIGETRDPNVDRARRLQRGIVPIELRQILDLGQGEHAILVAGVFDRDVVVGAHLSAALFLRQEIARVLRQEMRIDRKHPGLVDMDLDGLEQIAVGDAEIVEQMLLHQGWRFVAQPIGLDPHHHRAMLERQALLVEIGLDELGKGGLLGRIDGLDAVLGDAAHVENGLGDRRGVGGLGVDLDELGLVDGRIRQPEAELADEGRIVEMGARAPGESVARHPLEHAGAVVDEGHRIDRVGALVRLQRFRALEADVDAGRLRLDRIVDEFARRCGGVAVTAAPLGFERAGGVEQREGEVLGQLGEILFLPLDLGQQAVIGIGVDGHHFLH